MTPTTTPRPRKGSRAEAEPPAEPLAEPGTEPGTEPEPGTQPGGEPEHEPEHEGDEDAEGTEPVAQLSPEQQASRLDNAMRKYRADIERIIGPLNDAAPCPMCDGFAFVPSQQALVHHPRKQRCPDCRGLGVMITGSVAPGHETLPCPTCTGSGYTEPLPENVHALAPAAPAPVPPPAQQVHGWWDPVAQVFHAYGEAAQT